MSDTTCKGTTPSRLCTCGSGLPSHWAYDARNIPLKRVCEKCEKEALKEYRPDVLTNPNYWTDEPIDED